MIYTNKEEALKALVFEQNQYIEFLGKAIQQVMGIAIVHHFQFSKEDVEHGEKHREKIAMLRREAGLP